MVCADGRKFWIFNCLFWLKQNQNFRITQLHLAWSWLHLTIDLWRELAGTWDLDQMCPKLVSNSKTSKKGYSLSKQCCLKGEKNHRNAIQMFLPEEITYSRITHKMVKFTNSRLKKEHFHVPAYVFIHEFTHKKGQFTNSRPKKGPFTRSRRPLGEPLLRKQSCTELFWYYTVTY